MNNKKKFRFSKKLIPNILYRQVRNFYLLYLNGSSFKSFSSEGEDMILRKIFNNQNLGFYVDVGAFHPKKSSNTYYFYKQGWRGLNLDAMPKSMDLFERIRPRDINVEIPIGKDGEEAIYYEFKDKALNGFKNEILDSYDNSKQQFNIVNKYNFKCKSLNSVLEEYLPNNQIIDFISIDVEGNEMKILENFNFTKYNPKIIVIEILNFNPNKPLEYSIVKLLTDSNYMFFAKTINTVFFKYIP